MVCQADNFTDPVILKKVVKSVVQENRNRNVVIFGLPEKRD